tara:strand:+ start:88 stop:366 length:279 start_codon:yes stop_codon:yes gene_type:complete
MFNVSLELIKEYHQKSIYISETLRLLGRDNLIDYSGLEKNNVDRIIKTNHNNFEALNHSLLSGEIMGKMMFWFIKKTVDMNYKTVKSMEKRK